MVVERCAATVSDRCAVRVPSFGRRDLRLSPISVMSKAATEGRKLRSEGGGDTIRVARPRSLFVISSAQLIITDDHSLVHLPEIGIPGNTHFPMSDLNNVKIAVRPAWTGCW